MTRNRVHEELCLISQVETKSADEACKDDKQIQAMKEELDHIVKNETWELVPRPITRMCQEPNWYLEIRQMCKENL